ncbi:MAG: hypothetical protein HPY69_07575 [Armatimonadetes bacterium]|nr:hypothetical protein [Armatimonadota bacterium]
MAEASPFEALVPLHDLPPGVSGLGRPGEYHLYHFQQSGTLSVVLPGEQPYGADAIDTWNMSTTPLEDMGPG